MYTYTCTHGYIYIYIYKYTHIHRHLHISSESARGRSWKEYPDFDEGSLPVPQLPGQPKPRTPESHRGSLHMCMYVYVHVYMYTDIYLHIHTCVYAHILHTHSKYHRIEAGHKAAMEMHWGVDPSGQSLGPRPCTPSSATATSPGSWSEDLVRCLAMARSHLGITTRASTRLGLKILCWA